MGKPTICIAKTKTQISFAVTAKLISAFVFATQIVQFLFYLNPKFQASSSFLNLYRSVCVGPVWKPHCWFSHEVAHLVCLCLLINQCNYHYQNRAATVGVSDRVGHKPACAAAENGLHCISLKFQAYEAEGLFCVAKTKTMIS